MNAADKSWNNKHKPHQKSQEKLQGKLQGKIQEKLQDRRQQAMDTTSSSSKIKPVKAPLVKNVTSKPKLQDKKLKVS